MVYCLLPPLNFFLAESQLGLQKLSETVRDYAYLILMRQSSTSNGISGHLQNLFSDFLDEQYQRTVQNSKSSDWKRIRAGVPQESVLGPLLNLYK